VDDKSSDDTSELAATLLRAGDRLIRNEVRLGLNGNRDRRWSVRAPNAFDSSTPMTGCCLE
jgi:hypothetical protein